MEKPRWVGILAWFWQTRRGRFALLVLVLMVASALALLPVFVLNQEFNRLEAVILQRDAKRVTEGVQSELRVLAELSKDWGIWDDAFVFARDRNPAFVKANLGWDSILNSTQVQLIYVLDRTGKIIWGDFHPVDASHSVSLSAFSQERIQELPLLSASREEPHAGLFMTAEGPLLLVSQPIRHSNNQGPVGGTILMGRLLDRGRVDQLSRLLAIPFVAQDTLRTPMAPEEASAWAGRGWEPQVLIRSESSLNIRVTVPDIYEKERLILTLPRERAIHVQGLRAGRIVFASLFLATVMVAGALMAAFFQYLRLVRRHHDALEAAVASRTSELQDAERRFRAFVDHTHDFMFWCRLDESEGCFVLEGINPAALRFMGRPLAAVIGQRSKACLPPNIADPLERYVYACAGQRAPLVTEDAVDVKGVRMVFQTAFVPVPDETGKISQIAVSARDITAMRDKEEALLHTQKLESLGVLAGGIAHDFNNILTAAQGNLDISTLLLPQNAEALPHLESVRQALTKAANLTRQLLAYSGRGRFLVQVHDLNVAVEEMLALLEISISKKATLICDFAEQLPLLEADVAQIQQVIMNLVTNASDALQDKSGTIRVRTWAETLDSEAIARLPVQFLAPGPHVALEVSDTGSGMPPEVLERIFEPFFSTKGVGRGLGLSAMLGILRSHHGGLALESVPEAGTTFKLWFPASSQIQEAAESDEAVAGDAGTPLGMLLLVEDDPNIRNSTGWLLRGMGFPVVEAQDGVDGLTCFQEHQAEVRLVILDLTMPRMDGREFLAELRKSAPALPVIVTSGYSEQELPPGDPALAFLQKPYQARELRLAIFKALRHPG